MRRTFSTSAEDNGLMSLVVSLEFEFGLAFNSGWVGGNHSGGRRLRELQGHWGEFERAASRITLADPTWDRVKELTGAISE